MNITKETLDQLAKRLKGARVRKRYTNYYLVRTTEQGELNMGDISQATAPYLTSNLLTILAEHNPAKFNLRLAWGMPGSWLCNGYLGDTVLEAVINAVIADMPVLETQGDSV